MTNEHELTRDELRITCADSIELVTDYLESALNPFDLDAFETHLGLCEGCQVFLDQIRKTITLTSRSGQTTAPVEPADMDGLLAALDEQADRQAD